MALTGWLPERLSNWFSIRQPVSYWSFWWDLLRLAPVLVGLFASLVYLVGGDSPCWRSPCYRSSS